jgi:Outer membrane protein beta-barrel domain
MISRLIQFTIIFLPLVASAQRHTLAPFVGYNKTAMYNKEEHAFMDLPLPKASFAPSFGVDYRYRLRNEHFSISTGIHYKPIVQHFAGIYHAHFKGAYTNTMQYVQFPLQIQYDITKLNVAKLKPFVQAGIGINFLMKYRSLFRADYSKFGANKPLDAYFIYDQSGNKIYAGHNDKELYTNYTTSAWYYKRNVASLIFNAGTMYQINHHLSVQGVINSNIAIQDSENKSKMDFVINELILMSDTRVCLNNDGLVCLLGQQRLIYY